MTEEIKQIILAKLPDATIYIVDPDGQHFQAIVISQSFQDLSLIQQHRVVMNALKENFKEDLHALQLTTLTPEKWQETKHKYEGIQ